MQHPLEQPRRRPRLDQRRRELGGAPQAAELERGDEPSPRPGVGKRGEAAVDAVGPQQRAGRRLDRRPAAPAEGRPPRSRRQRRAADETCGRGEERHRLRVAKEPSRVGDAGCRLRANPAPSAVRRGARTDRGPGGADFSRLQPAIRATVGRHEIVGDVRPTTPSWVLPAPSGEDDLLDRG